MSRLAVIIPYYQKTAGILRRALESVLAQELAPGMHLQVIVVNDGSPSPPAEEITGLKFADPVSLKIVEQTNSGCAAARNSGLRAAQSADFIAFLDSDDFWKPDHIQNAISALSDGYDFYFTDHSRVGHHDSHFAEIDFPPEQAPAGALTHLRDTIWVIDKTFCFGFFLRAFTSQLSGVVYRKRIYPDAKFQTSLRAAGEDSLFLQHLISKAGKICFSTQAQLTCGDGVNIYFSKYDWGDEGHLQRHMGELLASYAFLRELNLSGADLEFAQNKMRDCRRRYAFFAIRWFLKGNWRRSKGLKELIEADPAYRTWFPWVAVQVGVLTLLKRYSPSDDEDTGIR